MNDSANSSPKWTRPSNTIKVKKRGRRGSLATENTALSSKQNNLNTGRQSAKRKNPFSCSQKNKKQNNENLSTEEIPFESRLNEKNELFQKLNKASIENKLPERRQSENEVTNNTILQEQVTTKENLIDEQKPKSQIRIEYDNFPVDWSIKTRLRFTSEKSYSWCASLKSCDEAAGMSAFVKCAHESLMNPEDLSQLKSMFHQHTMVWVHPSVPWFKSFPRIVPEPKIAKQSFAVLNDSFQKALFTSWCESFRSVFHLLRAKRCPYFYLCAHQFSILFQAAGIGGSKQVHAVITPTTKGLRDALNREGIEFSLPNLQLGDDEKALSVSPDISINSPDNLTDEMNCSENPRLCEEADDDDDITQDDEAASSWIQSIGLDKKEFPSLDPARVKFKRDKVVKLDNKPQSLVLVQGQDTKALFNFLLNSSTVVAVAGSQAGIPPTLLAPIAFEGATLQKCKVRNSVIKQKTASGALEGVNSLEISGVLLPNSVKGLCEVLKQTGSYAASFNIHEPTAPFNQAQLNTANQNPDSGNLSECGLSDHMISELYNGETLKKGFLREVLCKNGKYGWSL
ncbi:protein downstream neighbor of son homolog [Antedon mediterranea]|uniref:protein downstream neighbor of son homolog n=1 Tax=Antedon mediterranea TaxID=105859 RepID=UPI003AF836DE